MLKTKLIILLIIGAVIITSGLSCKLFPGNQAPKQLTQTIELSYWGVWDDSDYLQPIISEFQTLHPNVKITYRKFRYAEYKQQLLEAWAEDRGPDLYSLPAAWLNEYQSRITPQPETVRLAFQEVKKTLGKTEITTDVKAVPIFKPSDIKNKFAETVYNDVVLDNKVLGLPYSLDSLVLYYNRDLLDAANIATPPSTWTELKEAVAKLTKIDINNNIVQSGVSLGLAENIDEAADIVSLLMMQNGTAMVDNKGLASFQKASASQRDYYPGAEALRFYTDFADPIKEVYSWNNEMPNALDAFVAGKTAMFFGYAYHLPTIKGRAPKINLGISYMPQITASGNPVNFTDYWVETVSHKTSHAETAWGFINFAASTQQVTKYLAAAKKPAALRELINAQLEDEELKYFAGQTLTAKRWYRGHDAAKMEEIFAEMIDGFNQSPEPYKLLEYAASRINQTF
ncbi:MAG TPA: extracellular solute-binding protein [Patescibacteria group bacterium]|nr:extracellular solute-binding protein [Patescibacteria group bacterium]